MPLKLEKLLSLEGETIVPRPSANSAFSRRSRDVLPSYRSSAERIEGLVREVGDPQVVPIYLAEPEEVEPGSPDVTVLDAHFHGVFLIGHAQAVVQITEFQELDRAARVHPSSSE
jgi:hypothetical protein